MGHPARIEKSRVHSHDLPGDAVVSSQEGIVDVAPEAAQRLNAWMMRLPRCELARLAEEMPRSCVQRGVWMEEDGEKKPIALTLRPRTIDLAPRGYIHHVTWQIRMGLRRLARMAAEVRDVREALPLEPVEQEWIEAYRRDDVPGAGPGERFFCRLDALVRLDGPGWRSTLKFVEPNVVGIGGMWYSAAAEELMMERVVPLLQGADEDAAFEKNADPRDLLLDELCDHARQLGVEGTPSVALVDDKRLYTLGGELGRMLPWFERRGVRVAYVNPWELEVDRDGDVVAAGAKVDVVYRFLEIRELAALEDEGKDLAGMRRAFEQSRVVPSAGGDIEHKSTFEVLTRPDLRRCFTAEQGKIFDEHVLWTRLLYERFTTDPDGMVVDLAAYARKARERLVLKPNRAYGGEGILIGEDATDAAWLSALQQAFSAPGHWVVQEVSPPDVELFPFFDEEGGPRLQRCFAASGFYPGKKGLGIFGRYSRTRVVNIHSGGGMSPFLVKVS